MEGGRPLHKKVVQINSGDCPHKPIVIAKIISMDYNGYDQFFERKQEMKRQETSQYVITLIFTLIALIVLVTYTFNSFYSNAISNMAAMGESSLAYETEKLNGYLIKGMDVLQVTAITVEYMMKDGASPDEIEAFLLAESERYKAEIDVNFTGIYGLFDGNYLDGVGWVPDEDYVPQEREWYTAAVKAGGKPTLVSPYLDAQTNTIMISVSQLLYDGESVISLDIVMDTIQKITENINMDSMGYGFVIDKAGLVVAHSDETEKGKNYLEEGTNKKLLQEIYAKGKGNFRISIDGENCTVFTDVVMDDWYVSMVVSNTRLYQDIRSTLVQNIILCVVVFILIVSFCTLAFRKMQFHMKENVEARRKIEKLNDTVMRTLARTIDAKDRYTNGHSQRVAQYSVEIAKRMGKSEEELKNIYYAGLLHDVGKIHIPDVIINKPAKLTEEEFSYIKLHPLSGYHILKDIKENPLISQGAKCHHERYSGGGYPNGLVGDNIPEIARIIGVADAYDAMTSDRSYRKVMPQNVVRSEIEKGIGTQFDPEIAKIMLEMIDRDKDYVMRQKSDLKQIVVVDDEMDAHSMIADTLKDEPQYAIAEFYSGKEALEFLKINKADVILIDIQMPEMDGFSVFDQLRKLSNAPVVFLTEDKQTDTIERLNALGVEDYLIKPFMPQALLEIIHSILQEKIEL